MRYLSQFTRAQVLYPDIAVRAAVPKESDGALVGCHGRGLHLPGLLGDPDRLARVRGRVRPGDGQLPDVVAHAPARSYHAAVVAHVRPLKAVIPESKLPGRTARERLQPEMHRRKIERGCAARRTVQDGRAVGRPREPFDQVAFIRDL